MRGDGARIMTAAAIIRPRRRVFPGSAEQVGRARQFVGQVLGECPAADDAVLLTSELVTNAVTHTAFADDAAIITSELVTNADAPRGALLYPRCSREELKGGSWA